MYKNLILFSCLLWLCGCFGSSRKITFSSTVEGKVYELSFDPQGSITERELGSTPLEVDLDNFSGSVLKVQFPDGSEQVWVLADLLADETRLELVPPTQNKNNRGIASRQLGQELTRKTVNSILRDILKSYQALTQNKPEIALVHADDATKTEPGVAAPFILRALVHLQQGNSEKAITELELARSKDPDDGNIDKLLQSLQAN